MPLSIFPVSGGARISGDFLAARPGGRSHLGNDLFADYGTALLAVDDGWISFGTDPLGGDIAVLHSDGGDRYYYAHLSAYEGISGRRTLSGEVVGYIGMTGSAAYTVPHVHFEIHPGGGPAVDPYPALSQARVVTAGAPAPSSGGSGLLRAVGFATLIGLGAWYVLGYTKAGRRLAARLPA